MPAPLLSATLIVRNEERFLEGCLRSLGGRVDETVVVDTGSTDRSREIAGDLGARVIDRRWAGDFAAARNAAIDAARGAWVLYIDADERVVEFDRDAVAAELADARCACYRVLFRPAGGLTRYREYRLFRNRAELRFSGLIHESILPALEALRMRTGLAVGDSHVALDHLGYDGDLRAKHERNLPLLRARLARDPQHVYSLDHLGATLLALGDAAGAEAAWRRAIDVVRASGARVASDGLPWFHLATLLIERGHDAAALLAEACAAFPENHSLAWLRARSLVAAGDYAAAAPLFAALTRVDVEALSAGSLAFDSTIFGAGAHAALGLCAFRLGRYAESAAHYARAEAIEPANLELRSKRMLSEIEARRKVAG
ncbi:MAG TPA: glycosyltransferase [Casimicrobiaceae bacterium]|nr:glycosyltransferase [Casimicrobiaceae bacterium]